jgi:hypothetical protein
MGHVASFYDRYSYFTTKHGYLFPYTVQLLNQSQIFPPFDAASRRNLTKKLLNQHRTRTKFSRHLLTFLSEFFQGLDRHGTQELVKEFIYQIKSSHFNPRFSISEHRASTKQRHWILFPVSALPALQEFLTLPASSSNLLLQIFLGLPLLRYPSVFQLKTCFSVAEEFFIGLCPIHSNSRNLIYQINRTGFDCIP